MTYIKQYEFFSHHIDENLQNLIQDLILRGDLLLTDKGSQDLLQALEDLEHSRKVQEQSLEDALDLIEEREEQLKEITQEYSIEELVEMYRELQEA